MSLLALIAVVSAASANDANWVQVGDAGNFEKNPHIQMVKEDVRIELRSADMRVQATFWFKNHGPKTTATMAFPDETSSNNVDVDSGKQLNAISRIRSWVDGKEVQLVRRKVERQDDFHVGSVWTKSVSFLPGQTRKVVVDYVARNGFAGSGWVLNAYIFETGSTWRGKIEEMAVMVDWTKATDLSRPSLELVRGEGKLHPAKWRRLGSKRYSTVIRDVSPDFDLDLTMIVGFWNFAMNGKRMDMGLGLPYMTGEAVTRGEPRDISLRVEALGRFFGMYEGVVNEWQSEEAMGFGSELEWIDDSTLKTGTGRTLRLARPIQVVNADGSEARFVYLKDLIRALGGTYSYDPLEERVDLTLPKRKPIPKDPQFLRMPRLPSLSGKGGSDPPNLPRPSTDRNTVTP